MVWKSLQQSHTSTESCVPTRTRGSIEAGTGPEAGTATPASLKSVTQDWPWEEKDALSP